MKTKIRFVALGIGGVLAIAVVSVAFGGTAKDRAASRQGYGGVSTSNVNDVITEVEQAFGDGVIQSASVTGTTVTVQTSASDETAVRAGFEAAVLGQAV